MACTGCSSNTTGPCKAPSGLCRPYAPGTYICAVGDTQCALPVNNQLSTTPLSTSGNTVVPVQDPVSNAYYRIVVDGASGTAAALAMESQVGCGQ